MSEVKIPEGYKQTEVGVIPEDWKLLTIDDVASFSGGSQPPRSTFIFSPRPSYIRLIQIRDYKTSNFETYIPEHLANKKCKNTDIMIGRYGPPIFQILRGIEGAYNVALIKATPSNDIQREYLYYFLKTEKLFQLMELLSRRSSGQTGVELPALKAYPIPLPPKSEQTAIATALSDVDNLIQSLEKLIAKKEVIKTGTMQQLITGKTRLPEFATNADGSAKGFKQTELGRIPEDWEVRKVKSFTDCTSGGTPSTTVRSYWGGVHPWMSSGELHLKKVYDVKERITDKGLENSSTKYIPKNSILIGLAGQGKTRGTVAISKISLCTNQSIGAILPSKEFDSEYLYYNLDTRYEELRSLSTGDGGRGGLNLTILRNLLFLFPSKKEQTAIATTLSDMDAEIQALQQRLGKTKDIKQGMMQQLLTGKVRLLDSSAKSDTQTLASKGELQA
ncbi:restriction endonuclease subunit S [Psychrobacter sp. van23A]|uniref:restriction endonuclease subunit S n=1 Tax=Psychrobacter sp. van23A TaxID=3064892 RepID=UPI0027BA900D|nr:restriction endonuclease subunit S [Psychrobacter sp. van23A]WLW67292.1 restriction endonuclease subunit S [Psychrobacter sp. van23A]